MMQAKSRKQTVSLLTLLVMAGVCLCVLWRTTSTLVLRPNFLAFQTNFLSPRAVVKQNTSQTQTEFNVSTHCERNLSFSSVPLPITGLASFPGSGNTWMRHLLQTLTGIYTGAIYHDGQLKRKGFLGEGIHNGSVIAIKTHSVESRESYDRVILILRNPYDSVFAEFNRRYSASHVGVAPERAYERNWEAFTARYFRKWMAFHTSWALCEKPLLVVHFENLLLSLPQQLKQIAKFLDHPSLHLDITCALRGSVGRFRRTKNGTTLKDKMLTPRLGQHHQREYSTGWECVPEKVPEVSKVIRTWKKK